MTSTDTDRFVFEARLRYDGDRWSAIVPYDGAEHDLTAGARQFGVTAELRDARPDRDKPRRVKLSGSPQALQSALNEYARRATQRGAYRV